MHMIAAEAEVRRIELCVCLVDSALKIGLARLKGSGEEGSRS